MNAIAVLTVLSAAFVAGTPIPLKHAGGSGGGNVSSPLSWSQPPAGVWTHWVLFNLPPDTLTLPAGLPPQPKLANGHLLAKGQTYGVFGR
jgi:phosphatidylethanolamine-binding protein (PEBP) family uncharacterized protein